ncbi:methyltransferase domain protein [Synechococcus sp. RS9915]|nr:methyltransferase domain protein [Synechococcus sp. RS9915]
MMPEGSSFNVIRKLYDKYFLGRRYDLGHGKERQIASKLRGIREDHKSRYLFARSLCKSEERVLDCASGIGYGAFILSKSKHVKSIDCVDKDAFAHEYGSRYFSSKKVVRHHTDLFDFIRTQKTDSYSLVTSFETIEHLDDPQNFLIGLKLMLRADGRLILSSPNEIVLPFNKEQFPYHVKHYTQQTMIELLQSVGFSSINTYYQPSKSSYEINNDPSGAFLICTATA